MIKYHSFFCLEGGDEEKIKILKDEIKSESLAKTHLYITTGFRIDVDFVLWCAFYDERGIVETAKKIKKSPFRLLYNFWGYVKESQYTGRSGITMDIESPRKKFIIIYPFTKTHDWYQLKFEERAEMMKEHIKVGNKFKDIEQLLVYAIGIADWEFVVAYETDELERFSELVYALRETKARIYTLKDTPIISGILIE